MRSISAKQKWPGLFEQCLNCGDFFDADHRNRERQRFCAATGCMLRGYKPGALHTPDMAATSPEKPAAASRYKRP